MNNTYPSQLASIGRLAEDIGAFCSANAIPPADEFALNLVAEELFTNSVVHGYKGDGGKSVSVSLSVEGDSVKMVMADSAPEFDPFARAEEPDTTAGIESRQIGGLGVFFAKKQMEIARHKYEGGKNVITMFRKISK